VSVSRVSLVANVAQLMKSCLAARLEARWVHTVIGMACLAVWQIDTARADCPAGTVATTAIDGTGICYGTIHGRQSTLVVPMSACPAGMRSGGDVDNYKVCVALRSGSSVTAKPACPKETVPLMSYQGTTRCVADSRVPKGQIFTNLDGCPIGYAPGANSNGAPVCAQR
jgi:hypothetical protein